MTHRAHLASTLLITLAACGGQTPPPQQPATTTATATATATPAPPAPGAIVIGQRKTMTSKVMGEERAYLVHLPPGYDDHDASYPVIYLLDGDGHFHHVTGIVSFLTSAQRMPPAIVVGIPNTNRTRDLTPTNEARLPDSGGADRFLEFIETELIPQIERDYRTAPLRILVGHSFGGLFAVNAMIAKPDLFDAHIAASPSLQWDDHLMGKRLEPLLAKPFTGFLYYTLGTEPEGITAGNKKFAELLAAKAPQTLQWAFELMADEDHGSVVHRTVYRGLSTYFGDYVMTEAPATVAALTAHYERIAARYKLNLKPPEAVVNILGYQHLMAEPPRVEVAIEFFELNVKLYPESANVYDSLGESYERAGRMQDALANYEQAVARSKPGDAFYNEYRARRDRAAAAAGK